MFLRRDAGDTDPAGRMTLSRERKEELYRLLVEKEARRLALDLREFVEQAWHVVEPATRFVPGWHIDAICEHLEAVSLGTIRNLLINIPPRHMKSLLVSVFWPAWEWTLAPERRYLFSSYAESLAVRDSVKCRNLIESPWYRERWAGVFALSGDQNMKTRFENTATGYRLAVGVGGSATGEGGDRLVADDPHNVKEAESEAVREGVLDWWDQVMSTRGNNPKTVARVVVMQRCNERDLSGHLLERGGWEHLCMPAEYEGPRAATSIGWVDPRRHPGELLWPAHFGPVEIAQLKDDLQSGAAGQLQQRPAPPGGAIFKRDWWQSYAVPPEKFDYKIMSLDTAYEKKSDASYSVATVWGLSKKAFYLLDVWRDRVEFPELKRAAVDLYAKWKPHDVLIEDKASGKSLIQEFKRETRMPLRPVKVDRDKISRAHAVTPLVESGRCYLPESAPWRYDYLEELSNFPGAAFDDQVDSTTQALAHLRTLPGKFVVQTVGASGAMAQSDWSRF